MVRAARAMVLLAVIAGGSAAGIESAWSHSPPARFHTATVASAPEGVLVFTSTRLGGNQDVFVISTHGGAARRVSRGWGVDPAWSPDGRWIAYTTGSACCLRIELMRPNGSRSHALTARERHWQGFPAWSPDGKRVAYDVFKDHLQVEVATVANGQHKLVTSANADSQFPAWSPDGRWIAYERGPIDTGDVWLMHPNGSDQHPLTHDHRGNASPAWSPDGKQIIYSKKLSGTRFVFVMNVDGSHQHRLSSHQAAQPAWSPDGAWIVFTARVGSTENSLELFVMRSNGTGIRRLTHNNAADFDPDWKP
jgi:TolB protein